MRRTLVIYVVIVIISAVAGLSLAVWSGCIESPLTCVTSRFFASSEPALQECGPAQTPQVAESSAPTEVSDASVADDLPSMEGLSRAEAIELVRQHRAATDACGPIDPLFNVEYRAEEQVYRVYVFDFTENP